MWLTLQLLILLENWWRFFWLISGSGLRQLHRPSYGPSNPARFYILFSIWTVPLGLFRFFVDIQFTIPLCTYTAFTVLSIYLSAFSLSTVFSSRFTEVYVIRWQVILDPYWGKSPTLTHIFFGDIVNRKDFL